MDRHRLGDDTVGGAAKQGLFEDGDLLAFRSEAGGRVELVHTLNGSGLAIPRVIIAILETCQQADGSVRVPDVLVPYLGGQSVLEPVG